MGKEKIIFVTIVIVSLFLRTIHIDQSLWLDEGAQAVLSNNSIHSIWFERRADFHPPLFYIVTHFWQAISKNDSWLRVLPIMFGMANVIIMFPIGKAIYPNSKYAGHISAGLLSLAPFHVYYSQEYRSYSLLCLLCSISLFFTIKKKFLLLGFVNALILYTHYSGIFFILAEVIYIFAYQYQTKNKYLASLAISLFLFLPWLPMFIEQLKSGVNINEYLPGWSNVLSISPVKALPILLFKLIAGRINLLSKIIYGIYATLTIGIIFSTFLFQSKHRNLLTIFTFIPIGSIILLSLVLPQTQPFRIIFVLPILILWFTNAVLKYPKLFLTLFIYISIFGNAMYFTRIRLQREQWRQTGEFLALKPMPVIVKFPTSFAPLIWYQPDLPVIGVVPTFPAKVDEVAKHLSETEEKQVYLLDYLTDLTDPQRVVNQELIKRGYTETKIIDFPGVGFVREYKK